MKTVYGIFTKMTTVDPDTDDTTEDEDFFISGYGIWTDREKAENFAEKYSNELWNSSGVYYVLPITMED